MFLSRGNPKQAGDKGGFCFPYLDRRRSENASSSSSPLFRKSPRHEVLPQVEHRQSRYLNNSTARSAPQS